MEYVWATWNNDLIARRVLLVCTSYTLVNLQNILLYTFFPVLRKWQIETLVNLAAQF